jgi:very-short-patch-repair endonuclease
MDALINLKDCKEYMTINLYGKEHQIKLAGTVDAPYFCGKDVCEVLGYEAPKFALQRYVDEDDKQTLRILNEVGGKLSYNEGKAVYINKNGLRQLISKGKICGPDKLQQIADAFDLQLFITPRKEHRHLEAIEKTFSDVDMFKQFKVGRYRVDLYIEKYNLVVECDEYDHTKYNRREEEERELFIRSELGCDFIRFNPDAKEFSIFSVLGDIHKHILKNKG